MLTFTGWDRFLPGFALPKTARLKKNGPLPKSAAD